jgi:phosphatidylserine/phosphatidylglycerophosphate/cardiolipin synthase-like enzyme
MKYKIYTKTDKFWDILLKDIKSAKKSIYIEMYIFLDNTKSTHNFIEELVKKANSGLDIILILDFF